jgi:hypothetical protein
MPENLRNWVDGAAGIDLRAAQVFRIEAPYAYSLGLTAKVGFVCLPSIRTARAGL